MSKKALLAVMAALLPLVSCDDTNLYSTAYICRFMFRGDYHTTSILTRVLNNPGMFAKVTVQKKSGITHLVINSNGGDPDEDVALTTEIENRFDYSNVGANQCIIIGCTTTGEYKAYDGQCPYCLENTSSTNHPLSWTNNGASVTCSKCERVYNLNYDGICDDGNRLLQYSIRTDGGIYPIITVSNG